MFFFAVQNQHIRLKNRLWSLLIIICCSTAAGNLLAQPPGARPKPTPNGEIWMVDERWFESKPPFLEFYRFEEKHGLRPDGRVKLLLQDSRGDIWLADKPWSGLIRYDGHEFRVFKTQDGDSSSLLNNNIQFFLETPDGQLWMTNDNGFSSFDPKTERFRNFLCTLDSVTRVPPEFFNNRTPPKGFFDPETKRFVKAFPTTLIDGANPDRKTKTTFHWLLAKGWTDRQGIVWSFQQTPIGHGLVGVDAAQGITTLYPMLDMYARDQSASPDYDPWITTMYMDESNDNIWVAGWRGGLRRFHIPTKKWTQLAQNYRQEDGTIGVDIETILAIHPAPKGKLWLAVSRGFALFDPATMRFSAWWKNDDPGSFDHSGSFTETILSDKEGRLWVTSNQLWMHDIQRHFIQKPLITIPAGRIKDVYYDAETNKTWLLKEDNHNDGTGGLFCMDEGSEKLIAFTYPYFYDHTGEHHIPLRGLTKLGNDIFFVSEYALYQLNAPSGKLRKINIPAPPELAGRQSNLASPRDISAGADGSLWISVLNTETNISLVHYHPKSNRFDYIRTSPNGMTINAGGKLLTDSRGRIWLSSDHTEPKGINCYDPATGKVLTFASEPGNIHSLPHDVVNHMTEDNRGRIWMATNLGICYFDPADGNIHRIPGMDAETKFLTMDALGNIWIAGNRAGFYNPDTGKFRILGSENGLYWCGEVLYTRSDGAVCYGPYYRIFPEKIPVLKTAPVCRLTDFKVFYRDYPLPQNVDLLDEIKLPHTDNTFTINWSARNFTNPEQDTFYHRLEGIDDDWIATATGLRTATYLKLPPGNYTFYLKCKNRDGIFGPEKKLRIRIVPAYYQTWWFKFFLFTALIAIAALIASLRQRQKRLVAELNQRETAYKLKEAELQQRITEYQMAALRAQMNPHFFFNSLNSINRFVQLSGPDAASNYLTKFARLMRMVLDNSRCETISLANELDAVQLYLELESMRFADKFEYSLYISPQTETETIEVPPLFLQPYLENAIWHGLMQKESPDRKLDIRIEPQDDCFLVIQISDNGIGRAKAKELKSKSAVMEKSHGMDITAERLKIFTQRTGQAIRIEIEDLTDSGGSPTGTRIKIILETQADVE